MALALTTEQAAGTITAQATQQLNFAVANLKNMLANGVPAGPAMGPNAGMPALSASDIATAIGVTNVTTINSVIAALGV